MDLTSAAIVSNCERYWDEVPAPAIPQVPVPIDDLGAEERLSITEALVLEKPDDLGPTCSCDLCHDFRVASCAKDQDLLRRHRPEAPTLGRSLNGYIMAGSIDRGRHREPGVAGMERPPLRDRALGSPVRPTVSGKPEPCGASSAP